MIIIKKGNLLNATEDIIGHQTNCFTMGSGIAKQIIDKWSKVFEEHQRFVKENGNMNCLGRCQIIEVEKGKYIANLFGQYKYGTDKQYTRTDCLMEALAELKNEADFHGKSIALPYYIGSGRGGGDLKEIHDIINAVFWDYNVTLYKLK